MNEVGSLQIGHTSIKENDFKIECEVVNDRHVEVPFSHRHFFYAIYWVHEGSGKHIIDFEEYEIKSNRIFFHKTRASSFSSRRRPNEVFGVTIYRRLYDTLFGNNTKGYGCVQRYSPGRERKDCHIV